MKNLKYLLASLFIFIYNIAIFAEDSDGWTDDTNFPQTPPFGSGEGARGVPIDMYEGILLLLAVLLIVGYYFYTRNRKVA